MDRDGDNENDDYYLPIKIISGKIIIKPNRFGQATAIEIGNLTFQCNTFLQSSHPG